MSKSKLEHIVILDIAEAFALDRKEILKVRAEEDRLMEHGRHEQIKYILKNFCGIEVSKVEFKKSRNKNMTVELTIAMPKDPHAYGITINKSEMFYFTYPKKGKHCRYTLTEISEHGEESVNKIKLVEKLLKMERI